MWNQEGLLRDWENFVDLRFELYGEVCSSGQAEFTAINFGLQWKVRPYHSHDRENHTQYFHAYSSVSNKHFKYSTDVTAPLSAVECLSLFTVQVLASVAGPIFNERLHLHLGFLARPRGGSLDVCPSLSSLSAAHLLVLQSEPSQYLQPAAASSSQQQQPPLGSVKTRPHTSVPARGHIKTMPPAGGQLTAPPVTPRHAGMGWTQL